MGTERNEPSKLEKKSFLRRARDHIYNYFPLYTGIIGTLGAGTASYYALLDTSSTDYERLAGVFAFGALTMIVSWVSTRKSNN